MGEAQAAADAARAEAERKAAEEAERKAKLAAEQAAANQVDNSGGDGNDDPTTLVGKAEAASKLLASAAGNAKAASLLLKAGQTAVNKPDKPVGGGEQAGQN